MPQKRSNHYFSTDPDSKERFGVVQAYLRERSFEFLTATGVFSKKRVDLGTRLLIESMVLPEKGSILDVGCGYGAIGIVAAALNPNLRVIMIEVNKRAVWLTRKNIQRNNVNNAEVRMGNLYEPVKDSTFNCILLNPPISAGMDTVKATIFEAPKHMTNNGNFEIVVRSKVGKKTLKTLLEQTFGNTRILARKSGYRVFISEKQ